MPRSFVLIQLIVETPIFFHQGYSGSTGISASNESESSSCIAPLMIAFSFSDG